MKLWPTILKCEYLLDAVIEAALQTLSRVDIAEERLESIKGILGLAPAAMVKGKLGIRIGSLVWTAAIRETIAIDQAIEWPQIMLLADLSTCLNQSQGLKPWINGIDLIWVYCMIAGFGTEEEAGRLWQFVLSSVLTSSLQAPIDQAYRTDLYALEQDWTRLQRLQQMDVVEQLQDGHIPQVALCMHKVTARLVRMTLALTTSEGKRNPFCVADFG